jgi:lipopolysaccharide export LptBFGC system permease protein LptF
VVVRALVLNIPTVLVLTLPVATALAASLATGRLVRDNEMTVMRGVGTPLRRALVPVLVFGALVSLLALWISDRVVPWAWEEQQNIESVLYNLPRNPIEPDVAFKVENKYAFYVRSAQRTENGGVLLNKVVVLKFADRPDEYPLILTAETADYRNNVFTLRNGAMHRFRPDGTPLAGENGTFRDMTLNLRVSFSQIMTPPRREDQVGVCLT